MPRLLTRYLASLLRKYHDQTKKIYLFNDKYHAAAGNVMASFAMFQNECRSRFAASDLEEVINGKNAHSHSLKCSPLEGFITPRKVAETSTQLYGFEECHGESFAVCNRASLKSLAFAASDSSKSSIKIAYPERNGMGKTPVVIV